MMNFEGTNQEYTACPPTNVNEWVEQQLAAIRAEAESQNNDTEH
jgi:hypothetical protein